MLKPGGQIEGDEALEFYAKHTAQIEVGEPTGAEPAGAPQGGQPQSIVPAAVTALPACVWTLVSATEHRGRVISLIPWQWRGELFLSCHVWARGWS